MHTYHRGSNEDGIAPVVYELAFLGRAFFFSHSSIPHRPGFRVFFKGSHVGTSATGRVLIKRSICTYKKKNVSLLLPAVARMVTQ